MAKEIKRSNSEKPSYLVFTEENRNEILASYNLKDQQNYVKHGTEITAREITTDVHVRTPFTSSEYNYFRPNEAIPLNFRDRIMACREAYKTIGVVRNVIDMMTDFACEDLRIVHPDKKIEAFFKVWAKKVNISDVYDEFIRHLLIDGNVVVRRITAKLNKPIENQWTENIQAAPDYRPHKQKEIVQSKEIPWKYVFLNVALLEWIPNDTKDLINNRVLAFRLSSRVANALSKKPIGELDKSLAEQLPEAVYKAVEDKSGWVKLDMDKTSVIHSKKDSWEHWATPYMVAVLPDISFKMKLRQADRSALDGVINVIRLWKLGDHKEGILPDDGAMDKITNILNSNVGGGGIDIIWDSMIEMTPFYPPIKDILGNEKYDQVDRDILIGLGIPEVLIGGKGGNFSNSWIQLKTLVERLKEVRSKLQEWVENEIKLVCEAMNIDTLPKVRFNQMNLQDENISRKLIIGLLDRGLVSVESVLQAYGEDFLLEVERIKREKKLLKDAGIEVVNPLSPKEVMPANGAKKIVKPKNPKGRPSQTKDIDRKTRTPKVRTTASIKDLSVFALDAIDAIDEHIVPIYMKNSNVSNARKLTNEQKEELNILRTSVLGCMNLGDDLSKENILKIVESKENNINTELLNKIESAVADFASEKGCMPTLTQRKRIEALIWADMKGKENV